MESRNYTVKEESKEPFQTLADKQSQIAPRRADTYRSMLGVLR